MIKVQPMAVQRCRYFQLHEMVGGGGFTLGGSAGTCWLCCEWQIEAVSRVCVHAVNNITIARR